MKQSWAGGKSSQAEAVKSDEKRCNPAVSKRKGSVPESVYGLICKLLLNTDAVVQRCEVLLERNGLSDNIELVLIQIRNLQQITITGLV